MKEENPQEIDRREVLQAASKLPYIVPVVLAAVQARAQANPVPRADSATIATPRKVAARFGLAGL